MNPHRRTRIKICCMSSMEEIQTAINACADAVGFVCATPTSIRTIDKQKVAQITRVVPPPIDTFVLTSETEALKIAENVKLTGASTVQILSHISLEDSKLLSELLPNTKRVQVVHVESEESFDLIEKYSAYVHSFLLDSGKPNLKTPEFGGTGRTHDWTISAEFVRRSPIPVFLAGGLNSENVLKAIKLVRPYGVDLCSGARTNNRLDIQKLEAFINQVQKADADLLNEAFKLD
ncbi:MAG: N-(5'-phosphoribosyl)anthranilate isomerase [Flammeovirgaceae bacterium]|nr:N-(5'-phosphoribosyl)anthranilate isomerase [Flammeovirgaceae bacterium]HCX22378.1 N-(5'-phosphoribosyl)anthranilate isomerase [Cytophagales bacterium]